MGILYRPGNDCAKSNEFKNPWPAQEAKKPAAQECGLLLERKKFSGRGGTSTSVTCRPLLWGQPSNPAYRLFLSDHFFPSVPMLSYTTLFDSQAFYQSTCGTLSQETREK
jgi:hypothetical protein